MQTATQHSANPFPVSCRTEDDGNSKWYWEVPGWDNAWWDAAALMAHQGEAGPLVWGQPAFTTFLGSLADKWVNGKAPVQCAALPRACTVLPVIAACKLLVLDQLFWQAQPPKRAVLTPTCLPALQPWA